MPKRPAKSKTDAAPARIPVIGLCGRIEHGGSRPWLVEGADGQFYFLKRDGLSPDRLVTEFLISRLGEECGLPVPAVKLLEVPGILLKHAEVPGAHDLSPGIAFGSTRIDFAEELRTPHLPSIDEETRMRVICFDWWTRNNSRQLDRIGGDPNLLWDPVLQKVALIDHSSCLAADFDPVAFKRGHAFRDLRTFLEKGFVKKWRTRFESAIYHLGRIWDEIPEEWMNGIGGKGKVTFTRPDVEAWLMKPQWTAEGLLAD